MCVSFIFKNEKFTSFTRTHTHTESDVLLIMRVDFGLTCGDSLNSLINLPGSFFPSMFLSAIHGPESNLMTMFCLDCFATSLKGFIFNSSATKNERVRRYISYDSTLMIF